MIKMKSVTHTDVSDTKIIEKNENDIIVFFTKHNTIQSGMMTCSSW